jgi:hypothetical protein
MFFIDKFGTLRGALANGLLWGLGFAACGAAMLSAIWITGHAPPRADPLAIVVLSIKFGFFGVFSGIAFSLLLALLRRREATLGMGWVRFAVIGAVATGLFVPSFMQFLNIVSGDGPVPMRDVTDDAVWATAFGGVAAVLTYAVARRARTRGPV